MTTTTHPQQPLVEPLTPRQLEIARLISEEKTDKEIALELGIKIGTVKAISGMAKLKIRARSRVGLAMWYVQNCPHYT